MAARRVVAALENRPSRQLLQILHHPVLSRFVQSTYVNFSRCPDPEPVPVEPCPFPHSYSTIKINLKVQNKDVHAINFHHHKSHDTLACRRGGGCSRGHA